MITYSKIELLSCLDGVDANLTDPAELIVIGGAAAAIAYDVARATRDIDTWSALDGALSNAVERALAESPLEIPVEHAAVSDAPWEFETRLLRVEPERWTWLRIFVPERHDLVLMKCVRGYEHDLETASSIHQSHGLDLEILISRYSAEMSHIAGDRSRLDLNFQVLAERLFGEAAERRVAQALDSRRT